MSKGKGKGGATMQDDVSKKAEESILKRFHNCDPDEETGAGSSGPDQSADHGDSSDASSIISSTDPSPAMFINPSTLPYQEGLGTDAQVGHLPRQAGVVPASFGPPQVRSGPANFCAECGSRFQEKAQFCGLCGRQRGGVAHNVTPPSHLDSPSPNISMQSVTQQALESGMNPLIQQSPHAAAAPPSDALAQPSQFDGLAPCIYMQYVMQQVPDNGLNLLMQQLPYAVAPAALPPPDALATSGGGQNTMPTSVQAMPQTSTAPEDTVGTAMGQERRTTVMLRNIPNNLTQYDIWQLLIEHGFEQHFDFVYAPRDLNRDALYGFGFVNFTNPSYALSFKEQIHLKFNAWKKMDNPSYALSFKDQFHLKFNAWKKMDRSDGSVREVSSDKVATVEWADQSQGLTACIEKYKNNDIMHSSVDDANKPWRFFNGCMIAFEPPTKILEAPKWKTEARSGTAKSKSKQRNTNAVARSS